MTIGKFLILQKSVKLRTQKIHFISKRIPIFNATYELIHIDTSQTGLTRVDLPFVFVSNLSALLVTIISELMVVVLGNQYNDSKYDHNGWEILLSVKPR